MRSFFTMPGLCTSFSMSFFSMRGFAFVALDILHFSIPTRKLLDVDFLGIIFSMSFTVFPVRSHHFLYILYGFRCCDESINETYCANNHTNDCC